MIAHCSLRLHWMNCGDGVQELVLVALLLCCVAVVGYSCGSSVENDLDLGCGLGFGALEAIGIARLMVSGCDWHRFACPLPELSCRNVEVNVTVTTSSFFDVGSELLGVEVVLGTET